VGDKPQTTAEQVFEEGNLGEDYYQPAVDSMELLDWFLRNAKPRPDKNAVTFWRGAHSLQLDPATPIKFIGPCGMPWEQEKKVLDWMGVPFKDGGEPEAVVRGWNPEGLPMWQLPDEAKVTHPGIGRRGEYVLPPWLPGDLFWDTLRRADKRYQHHGPLTDEQIQGVWHEAVAQYRSSKESHPVSGNDYPWGPDFDAYHMTDPPPARAGPDP
jgi:hypothetical protein